MYIYVLTDPRTNEVRYVGKTNDLAVRRAHHIQEAKASLHDWHKDRWVRSLLSEGAEPEIHAIFPTDSENWKEDERLCIAFYLSSGARLTNLTGGGEGIDKPRDPEWNRRNGEAHRKPMNPDRLTRHREVMKRREGQKCGRGHEWTEENTYRTPQGRRKCRACANEQMKAWKRDNGKIKGTRRKTHCKNGHALTPDNIVVSMRGKWEIHSCLTCKRLGDNRRKKEKGNAVEGR